MSAIVRYAGLEPDPRRGATDLGAVLGVRLHPECEPDGAVLEVVGEPRPATPWAERMGYRCTYATTADGRCVLVDGHAGAHYLENTVPGAVA